MVTLIELIIWLCTLICLVGCRPTAHDATHDVTYAGTLSESGAVEYFKGVHYAQDTSGENRFAPPKSVPSHVAGTVVDASKRGAACPQLMIDLIPMSNKPDEISEDCLSLHIARPANMNITGDSNLPVLAWIFGGGAMYGSGSDPHTNPERLVELSADVGQPVIFVGINYRLGIFGFAASDTLKEQKSMNVGLRDQRFALEWIQQNIATFGGDPDRVTAYGLSAGGTFTSMQHVAYAGEKGVPFNQAYMMSGSTGTALNQTSDYVKVNTANVAEKLECPTSGQDMLDCMRKVSMERMVEVACGYAVEHHPPLGLFVFVAVNDGDLLTEQPSKLLREGRFVKRIPTILAWTEDDAAMLIGPGAGVQSEDDIWKALEAWNGPLLSDVQKAEILTIYPAHDFEEDARMYNARKPAEATALTAHYYRVAAYLRDLLFTCSSIEFTYRMQKHSQAVQNDFDSVWLYQLNQSMLTPMLHGMGLDWVGPYHGSDTNYIFNGVFPEGEITDEDLELSKKFATSIISFANNGNPETAGGFDSWPKAYEGVANVRDQTDLIPSEVNLLVIGGPHGTTPVRISREKEVEEDRETKSGDNEPILYDRITEGLGDAQQVVMDNPNMDAMKSAKAALAQQAIEKQKLFRRCEFIASISELMGV